MNDTIRILHIPHFGDMPSTECSSASYRNMPSILALEHSATKTVAPLCGCYFCLEVFEPSQITTWADEGETALCPKCDMDTVLAGVSDQAYLAQAMAAYFTRRSPESYELFLPERASQPLE